MTASLAPIDVPLGRAGASLAPLASRPIPACAPPGASASSPPPIRMALADDAPPPPPSRSPAPPLRPPVRAWRSGNGRSRGPLLPGALASVSLVGLLGLAAGCGPSLRTLARDTFFHSYDCPKGQVDVTGGGDDVPYQATGCGKHATYLCHSESGSLGCEELGGPPGASPPASTSAAAPPSSSPPATAPATPSAPATATAAAPPATSPAPP